MNHERAVACAHACKARRQQGGAAYDDKLCFAYWAHLSCTPACERSLQTLCHVKSTSRHDAEVPELWDKWNRPVTPHACTPGFDEKMLLRACPGDDVLKSKMPLIENSEALETFLSVGN